MIVVLLVLLLPLGLAWVDRYRRRSKSTIKSKSTTRIPKAMAMRVLIRNPAG